MKIFIFALLFSGLLYYLSGAISPKDLMAPRPDLPVKPHKVSLPNNEIVPPPPPPEVTAAVLESLSPEPMGMDNSLSQFSGQSFDGNGQGPGISSMAGMSAEMGGARSVRVKSRSPLDYPEVARKKGVSGFVKLKVLINEQGRVSAVEVLEANPAGFFEDAGIKAVRSWVFDPAIKDGKLIAATTVQKITFALE